MKAKRNSKLGTKIVLQTILLIFLVMAVGGSYLIFNIRSNDIARANVNIQDVAAKNAGIVSAELNASFGVARAIAQALQSAGIISAGSRRDAFNAFLQEYLVSNPHLLGTWIVYQPNKFDNLDSSYAGKRPDTDSTGRYISYCYRSGSETALSAVVDYEVPGTGDFYLLARDSGQETILEPFYYEIDGQQVLMTSLAVPVFDNSGTVIGVAGVDITLDTLQKTAFDKGTYESANFSVLTNIGTVVVHSDSGMLGKSISGTTPLSEYEKVMAAVSASQAISLDSISEVDQSSVKRVYSPITIGNTTTAWSACMVVGNADIMAESDKTTLLMVLIVLLILAAISLALFLIIKNSITKPLVKTVKMINEMSRGHLSKRLSIASTDEIGQMAQSMDSFCDYLQNSVIANMNRIAKGDVSIDLATIDSEDEITPALISSIANIRRLVSDTQLLANEIIGGHIIARPALSKHQGEYAKVIDGFNETLDAVIEPVKEAGAVIGEMAAGNLKDRVNGSYRGDHNIIKDALNSTLDVLDANVREIAEILTEIANSDLQVSVSGNYQGDFAPIKTALNLIIDNLNQVLHEMHTAADQVAAGSHQVALGSQSLSQGTTAQASSIEELTASLNEIAEQTRQNALSANRASDLTAAARINAVEGNQQMADLQLAMTDINVSSNSISKIIKVIDDIAFQTNILALNAAIEAARAGQQGKGFAVVAEEVRSLAARSARAANETTQLIESSISKVEAGTLITRKTAESLDKIVRDISEAAGLVELIASASNEQASGIAQIHIGVEQISDVVQANSATAEESAAASEELSSQAEFLKQMIMQFKIKND